MSKLNLSKPMPKAAEKVLAFAEGKQKKEAATRIFNAPEGYRRLTINLPESVHKKLKHRAIDQETTATAIIEELLAKHL